MMDDILDTLYNCLQNDDLSEYGQYIPLMCQSDIFKLTTPLVNT